MKPHKPSTIQRAIDELQTFLECDMPSKIFPKEKILGKDWKRQDPFKSRNDVVRYLRTHFEILEKQIEEIRNEQ